MAFHQMHLTRAGTGTMAAKTACGRNIHRAPLSTDWKGFQRIALPDRCAACEASKQADLNRRTDAKKAATEPTDPTPVLDQADPLDGWEPEADPNAWIARDAALIAAHRAK